jgi:hypothetical protein
LEDRTLAEGAKQDMGYRWTPFEWREYRDSRDFLSEFYQVIGSSPEVHSPQFWSLVFSAASNYLGGTPFADGNPGAAAFNMVNPAQNREVNTRLSFDIKAARAEVIQAKPTRASCKPLSPEEAAVKIGKTPYSVAANLYEYWSKDPDVNPALIFKYACQVGDSQPDHGGARGLVEQLEGDLKARGITQVKLDSIDAQCLLVSKGEANPDTMMELPSTQ